MREGPFHAPGIGRDGSLGTANAGAPRSDRTPDVWSTGLRRGSQRWRWPAFELVLLAVVAPALLFPQRFGTPLAIAGCLVLAVPRLWSCLRQGRDALTPLGVPVMIVGLMAGVSSSVSVDWSLSQPKFFGIMFSLGTYFATSHAVARLPGCGLPLVVSGLAVQGGGIALLALVGTQWTLGRYPWLESLYQRLPRLITEVQSSGALTAGLHPAEVGGMLVLLLPCALSPLLWPSPSRLLQIATALASLLITIIIVLTASRSAYAGVLAALALLTYLRAPRVGLALASVGVLAFVAAVTFIGPAALVSFLGAGERGELADSSAVSWHGRVELWSRAVYMLQDFSFTGIGLNTFPIVLDALYPTSWSGSGERVPHAHNLLLQTGVDLGVPGLMAFLWICGLVLRCWVIAWRAVPILCDSGQPRARGISVQGNSNGRIGALAGLLAGVVGHFVFGLTDAVTLGAKPGYLLWMMFGAIVAAGMGELRPKNAAPPFTIPSTGMTSGS